MWGSFANVVIYRWPDMSVVTPRSHCQNCKSLIAWYDNIPIFSWFILRGRCRKCKAPYSIRYAMVELLMASLFTLAYFKFGISWTLLEILLLLFGLVTVSFIDLDRFLLPDIFTLSGIVIGLIGGFLNPERSFAESVLGVFLGGGFLWSIAHIYFLIRKEEGMGGGDIKLLAWLGAVLGWKAIPFIILSSSLLGSFVGIALAMRSRKGMKTVIPFGPYLALGAVIYIFVGESLAELYLQLFIPGLS
jgi:leader peptidase (prepilin peptidase)/N-methyltransferase